MSLRQIPVRSLFAVAIGVLAVSATAQDDPLLERLRALEQRLTRFADRLDHEFGAPPAVESVSRHDAYERHRAKAASTPHRDLRWQFLGPTNVSGRVTDVAIPTPRGATYTMFVAGASGGVWKTDNEGTTWTPVFEHAPSTSIGDVTIAPSNPDIVWIGTGEANILRSSMAGCGVYKSTDGGATWQHKGLTGTHTIPRIVVHPHHPEIVYVASSGHEWSENPERGVYKTTDGGDTWERVFFVDERTGVIDLAVDPADSDTLYAATWQRQRRLWSDPRNDAESDGSAVYKTTDAGRTWRAITDGLPPARYCGRIGLDVCRSRPNVVYALIDNYDLADPSLLDEEEADTDSYGRPKQKTIRGAEVYRSDDRGATWRKVSESNRAMLRLSSTYGWVFGQIRVDPSDPDVVYVMGLALNVSRDGGRTFERLRGMHGDHHALWIDPANPRYLVNGNDGGVCVSYDGGANWRTFTDNLPMVQFYNVACDMAEPFHVYGSIQDHGSRRAVVDLSRGRDRIRPQPWERAPGGEASYHAVDPTDPDTVYFEGFYGSIGRADLGEDERVTLTPKPADGEPPLRGQWLAPFLISPHNPRIVYHGMNRLYRSLDRGDDLQPISPDLTGNDPETMGDIPFHTITTIAESPLAFGVIYVGTDDGLVHVTVDDGRNWHRIDHGLEPDRWISRVEASRWHAATVYVAQNGKRHDDFTPYLWKSTDYGTTWTSIAADLPLGPINVVREDPKNPDLLYVGTDCGVYVSSDRGETWEVLGGDLPTTFVHDLVVHPRDDILVIATHGRGMYAIDVRSLQGESGSDDR